MTIDAVIATLNKISDRAELVALLAPLRLSKNLDIFTATGWAPPSCAPPRAAGAGGFPQRTAGQSEALRC
jgi:hypothetical protein